MRSGMAPWNVGCAAVGTAFRGFNSEVLTEICLMILDFVKVAVSSYCRLAG